MTLALLANPDLRCGRFNLVTGGLLAAGRIARRWLTIFLRWRRNRRAMAQLAALDGRMLHDIGVSRGQIPHLVHHGRRTASADRPHRKDTP